MSDVIYWIIFFGIFFPLMNWFTKQFNTKLPKSALLTDKEVNARLKEKFPFWYHLYFPLLIFSMVGVALGLVFASWYFLIHFPQWKLTDTSYLALSTNPGVMYLTLLVFLPGIILGAFAISPLYRMFPGILRYVEKNQIKNRGLRVRGDAEAANRPFILAAVISSAVIIPILLLAADNYYYVDEKALHFNSFFRFEEEIVSLDSLQKVEAGAWPNNGRGGGINWKYVLVFKDGDSFNMKEAGAANLKKLDTFLSEKGVPVEVSLREGAIAWVEKSGSQDLKDLFAQVFSDSR